uniref:Uncharacterized protein n=1 Tax=Zea mays TaxID=4577 RepID=C4J0N8_MAIZE|nr:unknown [Zea mays]ACR37554.1 unknown [Zea mays]
MTLSIKQNQTNCSTNNACQHSLCSTSLLLALCRSFALLPFPSGSSLGLL